MPIINVVRKLVAWVVIFISKQNVKMYGLSALTRYDVSQEYDAADERQHEGT